MRFKGYGKYVAKIPYKTYQWWVLNRRLIKGLHNFEVQRIKKVNHTMKGGIAAGTNDDYTARGFVV